MEAWRAADLHAYVDNCLEPDARLTFENLMAQDPALARRAAQWRAQNSAIRAAFDGESAKTFSISMARQQHETFGRARRAASTGARPSYDPTAPAATPSIVEAARTPARTIAPDAPPRSIPRRLGLAALALSLSLVWSPASTVIPAHLLGQAAAAAFQAFARPGAQPVEFATSDAPVAQKWLATQLSHPVNLPATPPALRLVGARIAPYPGAPAAFLVYKSQDGALGLLVRGLDAPSASAPQILEADGRSAAVWAARGQGFALAGDPDSASLLEIATEFFGPPSEGAQTTPERGW
jgi:anti-sigma factor RsiW